MRVTKWGIGIVMAGTILLTGCAAPTDSTGSGRTGADASEKPSAAAPDCPELAEGTTVDGDALSECITEAMADTKGFATTMTVMGMESTRRYSPSDAAAEMMTPYGSMIIIGDEAWVKPTNGEWQVSDPASEDPEVMSLSKGAEAIDPADPLETGSTAVEEYTVSGTSARLDHDVFVLTGRSEVEGTPMSIVFEVTADHILLASTATSEASGEETKAVLEVTSWDEKQDIAAPL